MKKRSASILFSGMLCLILTASTSVSQTMNYPAASGRVSQGTEIRDASSSRESDPSRRKAELNLMEDAGFEKGSMKGWSAADSCRYELFKTASHQGKRSLVFRPLK